MMSRTTRELSLDATLDILGELRPTSELAPLQVEWLVESASKLDEPAARAPLRLVPPRATQPARRHPKRTRRMRVYNFRPIDELPRTRTNEPERTSSPFTLTHLLAACIAAGLLLGHFLL